MIIKPRVIIYRRRADLPTRVNLIHPETKGGDVGGCLIGPLELSAWSTLLDSSAKTFTCAAVSLPPIKFARSGHPCMGLLAYEERPKENY